MKKLWLASALSLALLGGTTALAHAEEAKPSATQNSVKQGTAEQKALAKIAQNGFDAVNAIQAAREALFEGLTDESTQLVDKAAELLKQDKLDWNLYAKTPKNTKDLKGNDALKNDQYVVINSSLLLAENFEPTETQQEHLKVASQKFNEGDEAGAIEEFKVANVALDETLILLPLKSAQSLVAKAQTELKNKKYYEANLTLKKVVDSLIADNLTIVKNN